MRKDFNQLFDSLSFLQAKHHRLDDLLESDWKIVSDVNVMKAELAGCMGLSIELPFSSFLTTVSLEQLEATALRIRNNLTTALQKKAGHFSPSPNYGRKISFHINISWLHIREISTEKYHFTFQVTRDDSKSCEGSITFISP